jgi:hypothetical protein
MDIKFVILLVVALAIVFLLISEIYGLKSDMDKKFNDMDLLIEKNNEEIKNLMKKELNTVSTRFKTYTNEMIQQIRTMNSIEKQQITLASDHFVENDSDDMDLNNPNLLQIPYLSEMPPGNNEMVQGQGVCKRTTKETEPYMSNTDLDKDNSDFKVKELYHSPNMVHNNLNQSPRSGDQNSKNSHHDNDNDNENENTDSEDSEDSDSEDSDVHGSDDSTIHNVNDTQTSSINEYTISPNHNHNHIPEHPMNQNQHDEISNKSNDSHKSIKSLKSIKSNDSHKSLILSNDSQKSNILSKDSNDTKILSNKTPNNETKMKLEKYKKLQESMENDDLSSQEITIGSSAKGGTITIKTSKGVNANKTIIDDLSLCTTDDNESGAKKMKSIAKYTKIELEELAKTHGIQVPNKSNKTMIYNALKQIIDAK